MYPTMQFSEMPVNVQTVLDRLDKGELNQETAGSAATLIRALSTRLSSERLTVDINTNILMRGGVTIRVTPSEAVLVHAMLEAGKEPVSVEALNHALHGNVPCRTNTTRVIISALRKKLVPLRANVSAYHRKGYTIELQPITSEVTS